MREQPTLFDAPEPLPYAQGSRTSLAAARRKQGTASFDRERVFQYLKRVGKASRPRIAHDLGLSENSLRPRVWELLGRDEKHKDLFPVRIVELPETENFRGSKNCALLKVMDFTAVRDIVLFG